MVICCRGSDLHFSRDHSLVTNLENMRTRVALSLSTFLKDKFYTQTVNRRDVKKTLFLLIFLLPHLLQFTLIFTNVKFGTEFAVHHRSYPLKVTHFLANECNTEIVFR